MPTLTVNAGRSGDGDDAALERLRRRYPRWSIWRGRFTGDYWAMPPRGHPTRRELTEIPGADQLAPGGVAEAEGLYDP